MVLIDDSLECFKGNKKDVKCLKIDNAGENQATTRLCKESYVKVECIPLDAPKLNNMVKRGFNIG